MITALYRISSNEVVKISLTGQSFADRNQTYWGVITDPSLPDGNQVRETLSDGTLGPLRVLGFAKIREGTTVRNATQGEINTFAGFETTDINILDATRATELGETHPQFRKLFKAVLKGIITENNIQATQWNTFRAQVALASNLTDLKNRVANNTTNMPIRTLTEAALALKNDISPND